MPTDADIPASERHRVTVALVFVAGFMNGLTQAIEFSVVPCKILTVM